jgi:hypothetical protein
MDAELDLHLLNDEPAEEPIVHLQLKVKEEKESPVDAEKRSWN